MTRVEVGPQTFIRQDHEEIVTGSDPQRMISLPHRHYCEIENPVVRNQDGTLVKDKFGQFSVQFGEIEIRF